MEEIETFESIACARRLLDLTISITQGAERMGMNAQATEAMRNSMEAHKRVHQLFIERTGLHIKAFDDLFGKSESNKLVISFQLNRMTNLVNYALITCQRRKIENQQFKNNCGRTRSMK